MAFRVMLAMITTESSILLTFSRYCLHWTNAILFNKYYLLPYLTPAENSLTVPRTYSCRKSLKWREWWQSYGTACSFRKLGLKNCSPGGCSPPPTLLTLTSALFRFRSRSGDLNEMHEYAACVEYHICVLIFHNLPLLILATAC